MPNLYYYLIASLPMLHFAAKPPFSFEKFLQKCRESIPEKDAEVLENLTLEGSIAKERPIIRDWLSFNVTLRNELVKLRATRKKIDPTKYLRPDGYTGLSFYHIALAAQRNPSPLEGEKILDMERWNFLESLSFGHHFDLDFLIIYAYKLSILERWERINSAEESALLEEALKR
ncbi:MAG: DUF2764 family protein [Candidatus Omnitrophota bacterium]|nr:DUF2764 family protein [Candidatus Omnitrophota bacterium]